MSVILNNPVLLLVEDDAALRGILVLSLTDEGFEVVVAKSGTDAITALEANGKGFKAVITDIRLGKGPDGWAVGHRARELAPGTPVIYMSGDSAFEWSANGVPESVMLQKPFAMAQLVTALTTLMNTASQVLALSEAMAADGKASAAEQQ